MSEINNLSFVEWAKRLVSGNPHFIIYTDSPERLKPQLLRWWLIPRNRFLNVYLHKIIRNDEERALHDHPWKSVSFLLRGRLGEVRHRYLALLRSYGFHPEALKDHGELRSYEMKKFRPKFRTADYAHRLFLPDPSKPAWTLFITGPKIRKWGFHCPKGWIRWEKFVSLDDSGKLKGCGEYG